MPSTLQALSVAAAVLVAPAIADVSTLCEPYETCFDCAPAVTAEDYVQFRYGACQDQLNIVPDHLECRPFETDNFTYPHETLKAGEYKHYHWTLTTYALINDAAGASITFEVVPEYGYPQMYTKAQILYGGMPMCQMFKTEPGGFGIHSPTWPFPDNSTGAEAQGPEIEIAELEASNTPSGSEYVYPGSVFSEVTWGFNASGYDSDKRPKVHTVTIPHVSYGGYFVSVYAGDGVDAAYSIRVNAVRTIDMEEEEDDYAEAETPAGVAAVSEWWLDDVCSSFGNEDDCTDHCCSWEEEEPEEESRRRLTEVDTPAFQRKRGLSTGWPKCVQAPIDTICVSQKDSDDGSNTSPEPTVLVSYQTGADPTDLYQLYYVEMNDCASQMDKNGQKYCWQMGWYTDGDRLKDYFGKEGEWIEPEWDETCGGDKIVVDGVETPYCDPTKSDAGFCNFDGTGSKDGTPAETMWTHAYDCIVWTPKGLARHGLPVGYTKYQDEEGTWQELDTTTFNGDIETLYPSGFNSSLRIKAIVTDYDRDFRGLANYDGWLTLPTNTWITCEIGIYNNVSYFFNVLKQKRDGTLDCYKGTSARTKFWRQTTLIPVEMIEIIAVIVIVLLLALLVPFILTKRKITAHLRDVYESHKYKGYLKGVEERVMEERARRAQLKSKGESNADHPSKRGVKSHQIQPVDSKEGEPTVTDQTSADL
eukprot:CAMPEP_0195527804 /NCGR_PEP_ID=MMETSP0794_2-20130614/29733_1 /TAXON_ID=515487 /ORGANISM="Stephanopyxis turris, Strain CCMP 815" /LENGTH=700 /DNA_ID=CAMNT_0040658805 /DNA_START=128 /DNA_END=2230 /DNA_ORIENTATION=+